MIQGGATEKEISDQFLEKVLQNKTTIVKWEFFLWCTFFYDFFRKINFPQFCHISFHMGQRFLDM